MFTNSISRDGVIWLKQISQLVDNIIAKKTPIADIEGISKYVNRCMKGYKFDVVLVKESKKPFIMSIYPDYAQLQKRLPVLTEILTDIKKTEVDFHKAWNELDHWVIEIDGNLLDPNSPISVTNGDEFVAILCHEMGHVMFTNPYMLAAAHKNNRVRFSRFEKMMMSKNPIVRQFMLPVLVSTLTFKIVALKRLGNTVEEIKADLMVPDEFKSSLVSYLDHSIINNPSLNSDIIIDREEMDKHIVIGIVFSKEIIDLMKIRKHVLVTHIKYQHKETSSPYVKNMMKDLLKNISGSNLDNDKVNIIKENGFDREYARSYDTILNEATLDLQRSRVTERELYLLHMDIESIKDRADKSYVLHTIFDYIEIIEKENFNKMKKMSSDKIPDFIKHDKRLDVLAELKEKVIKIKVKDNVDYGVYVNYPAGYEG